MLLAVTILKVDFGPMKKHEMNAFKGDLFTTPGRPYESDEEAISNDKAHVICLVYTSLWDLARLERPISAVFSQERRMAKKRLFTSTMYVIIRNVTKKWALRRFLIQQVCRL